MEKGERGVSGEERESLMESADGRERDVVREGRWRCQWRGEGEWDEAQGTVILVGASTLLTAVTQCSCFMKVIWLIISGYTLTLYSLACDRNGISYWLVLQQRHFI